MALRGRYFGGAEGSFFLEPSIACKYWILRGGEGERNLEFNRGEGRLVYYVGFEEAKRPAEEKRAKNIQTSLSEGIGGSCCRG